MLIENRVLIVCSTGLHSTINSRSLPEDEIGRQLYYKRTKEECSAPPLVIKLANYVTLSRGLFYFLMAELLNSKTNWILYDLPNESRNSWQITFQYQCITLSDRILYFEIQVRMEESFEGFGHLGTSEKFLFWNVVNDAFRKLCKHLNLHFELCFGVLCPIHECLRSSDSHRSFEGTCTVIHIHSLCITLCRYSYPCATI